MNPPLCQYASKPCFAPRALKENGEFHRLCDAHRLSANEAQRRWHARQQLRKRLKENDTMSRRATVPLEGHDAAPSRPRQQSVPMIPVPSISDTLDDEDLAMLCEILLDEEEEGEQALPNHWPQDIKVETTSVEFSL